MADLNRTEIVVILDRSGSMYSIKKDMEGGFDTFIKQQKALDGECFVSLYQFDHEYSTSYEARPISEVQDLVLDPRGTTALFDSVGKTVANVRARHKELDESKRPAAVILMVITDGGENASKEYTLDAVQKSIKLAEDEYNWEVVFMAADATAFAHGGSMGVKQSKLGHFTKDAVGTQAMYGEASASIGNYRNLVRSGDLKASVSVDVKTGK